ncbi:MAG TPA: hypothetical protein PLQ93_06740 [Bacteroidia bacterium]|nr:hypothetical protein [Bacteroidia bacterium]
MRRPELFLLILLGLPLFILAQGTVYTFIQTGKPLQKDPLFFFQNVIDARNPRDNIGSVYDQSRRKKYPANFRHELYDEFMRFYAEQYPLSAGKTKLQMLVKDFSIGHEINDMGKDLGSAFLSADIYVRNEDTCFLLCHIRDSISEPSDDVRLSHPNRIRRLLLKAGAAASASLQHKNTENNTRIPYTELRKQGMPFLDPAYKDKDSNAVLPNYYMFKCGTFYSFSSEVLLFGVSAGLLLQVKQAPRYLVGANAELMLYGVKSDQVTNPNTNYAVVNYNLGITMMKQIRNNFFFHLNPQLVLGRVDKTGPQPKSEKLTGFELDLGVYLIPPRESGVYSGLNFFYRSCNSSLYGEGPGLKIDLGMRF